MLFRRRALAYGALCLGLVFAIDARPARAECTMSTPSLGVQVKDCTEGSLHWVEAFADLATVDVAVRVSRPAERGRTVEEWASGIAGAVLAVQAGPFRFPTYDPVGLTVGSGEHWLGSADDGSLSLIGLNSAGVGIFVPAEQIVPHEPLWMDDVISGPPILVDGYPLMPCRGDGCEQRPRTAIGLSEGAQFLVVVAVEGWTERSPEGVTDVELARMALRAGASDAIRTGDGATSVLWTGGALAVPSSDGASRPTAAFLGLFDVGSGAHGQLVGVIKRSEEPQDAIADARVTVRTLDGTVAATGPVLASNGFWEFDLPARSYIVTAAAPGYVSGCRQCEAIADMQIWCTILLRSGSGEETCAPEPRVLEVGPWPTRPDVTPDAGMPGTDAGPRPDPPPPSGGCSCDASAERAILSPLAGIGATLALVIARARRRRRRGRPDLCRTGP